jgi:MFS superfamily sulfate permease-like transporter
MRSFASAHKYQVDANQELSGSGAANFGAGLFQGLPIGSSLSKSAANDRAGAHSQMSGHQRFLRILTAPSILVVRSRNRLC